MIELFHYTDDPGAEKIIRSGRIWASLWKNGDAVFGNGVYLTNLKPESSTRAQVAQNNWINISDYSLGKTKNVFVLDIPENEVENVSTETRNIFKFGGREDLSLVKYSWYLKDYDTGKILASHKYHLGSTGPAAALPPGFLLGDYVMIDKTVNGRPVYKNRFLWHNHFLFMSRGGNWLVGPNTGKDDTWMSQKAKYSLGPDPEEAWGYLVYDADGKACWKRDDYTLKAYPWHKDSQWKTVYHSESIVDPGPASSAVTLATDPATRLNTPSITPAAANVATATTTATTPVSSLTPTVTTPASSLTPTTSSVVLPKSTATSSKMPDRDGGNGLQSPGTTRSGRVYGGPPIKKTRTNKPASTPAAASVATASTTAITPASTTASSLTTTAATSSVVLPKSTATSSKMPDPDGNGLQSSGTTRSGRVYGGPLGKTLALMLFSFVLVMLLVFGLRLWYYPFEEKLSSK